MKINKWDLHCTRSCHTVTVDYGPISTKLSDMLLEVAKFYEGEVSDKTKNMSTIVEPFLMVIVGVAVGFFAISMISPIYSLSSSI